MNVDPALAWTVFTLALTFTIACIAISCCMIADDLADTLHELELDELCDDWIEP